MKRRDRMKITITISKKDAKHLASPHTFYDGCEEECKVMVKIQREIDKKFKESKNASSSCYEKGKTAF